MSEALPRGWTTATVEDCAAPERGAITDGPYGSNLKTSHYTVEGPRVIRLGNIGVGALDMSDEAHVAEDHFAALSRHHVEPGDVVIAALGDPVGRACCVPDDIGPAMVKADCFRLRPGAHVDRAFLMNWFNSPEARDAFLAASHGMGRIRINLSDFRTSPIPLPPLPEQRRIVAKLDRLSARSRAARDHLARTAALAARAKQAILAAAFSGELTADWRERNPLAAADIETLQDRRAEYAKRRRGSRLLSDSGLKLTDLGTLPRGWFPAHLAEIAETTLGYAFKISWFRPDGTRLVRGANVAPGRIDWGDTKYLDAKMADDFSEYLLEAGVIVLAMDRPLISSGFKVAVVDHQETGALLVQRVARLRAMPEADQRFIWWLINGATFIAHVIGRATGGDLPHISGNDILTAPVPVPSLPEQHEIVRRIETAFACIDRLTAEAARAAQLLDRLDERLLAKAFRGELVPQDPADEPAKDLLARIRAARAAAPKQKRGRRKKGAA